MKHKLIATGNATVNMDSGEHVLCRMDCKRRQGNTVRDMKREEDAMWSDMYYLGMVFVMKELGLIHDTEIDHSCGSDDNTYSMQ